VKIRINGLLIIAALLLAGLLGWGSTHAQTIGQQYFPETGHIVTGEFLNAYYKVPNPLLVYGYPITEAFLDPSSGLTVQYFQRARFELRQDAPPELRVKLTPLGSYLYEPGTKLPIPENSQKCRLFPETGFQVCYAFLDFFNANGGVAQFGYPISGFEDDNERIVQYFQRARFEWHPEYSSDQSVTLTDLGRRYFDAHGEDKVRLLPIASDNLLPAILNLRLSAFPARSVTTSEGVQTVYVVVQDQNLLPVENAKVKMTVSLPSGEQKEFTLPPTNERGISQQTFAFDSQAYGLVRIEITASFKDLVQRTVTSFRLWW
jgi:hypothetical protein